MDTNKCLDDPVVISCLNDLQDRYVMTPVDKADSNVAFICKKYYVDVLVKELGLGNETSNTYKLITNLSMLDVVKKHIQELNEMFGIKVIDDMQILPVIYLLPKLHKGPI